MSSTPSRPYGSFLKRSFPPYPGSRPKTTTRWTSDSESTRSSFSTSKPHLSRTSINFKKLTKTSPSSTNPSRKFRWIAIVKYSLLRNGWRYRSNRLQKLLGNYWKYDTNHKRNALISIQKCEGKSSGNHNWWLQTRKKKDSSLLDLSLKSINQQVEET